MRISKIFEKLFIDSRWCCAYRVLNEEELSKSIVPQRGEVREYHVIDIPNRYWIADPFLLTMDGKNYLYFECMDCKKGKAVLSCKEINPDTHDFFTIFEFKGHTSYPCIYKKKNAVYMIPETVDTHNLQLLICDNVPEKWHKVGNLLENFDVVDSTPFERNERDYIFMYSPSKGNAERVLFLGELNLEKCKIENIRKICSYNAPHGRPGGNVVIEGNRAIRIVQPGDKFYGEKLEFYSFDFTDAEYHEEKVGELLPEQIKIDKKFQVIGVHTINRCGNIEVIDLKPKRRFDLFKPIKQLLKIMGLFGYGLYEKRFQYLPKKSG